MYPGPRELPLSASINTSPFHYSIRKNAIELMSAGKSDFGRFGGYHLFNYASGLIFLLSDKIVGVDNFVFGGGKRRSRRSVCIRTRRLPGKVLN